MPSSWIFVAPRGGRGAQRSTVAVALLLLATACAPDDVADDNDTEAATARFVAVDIDYAEVPEQLPAGDVTVELVNEGQLQHNVVFEELGDDPVVEAAGGETATGSVTLEPGEHVVYCSVTGHRDAGMEATITVEG